MTITFDELTITNDTAAGVARRRLRSVGFTGDGTFGIHRRRLRSYGWGVGGALDGDPEVPALGAHNRYIRGAGEAFSHTYVDGSHGRHIGALGFGDGAGGIHRRRIRTYGLAGTDGVGYGILMTEPFFMSGFGSTFFESFNESIAADVDGSSVPIYGLVERIKVRGTPDDTLTGLCRVMDSIEFGDALSVVLRELLAEGFTMGGTLTDNYRAVEKLLEALAFSGLASSQLEAGNILVAALALSDMLTSGFVESLSDTVDFDEAMDSALSAAAVLVEQILASATGDAAVRFTAVVEDRLLVNAEAVSALSAVELLREGVSFALHINVDDGNYVAYSINTENKAVTEYTNFPYNSFARFPVPGGWRYFGMAPDGIRELDGTDDAGGAIPARFRLALTNLGHGQLKRMQAAYLGYTSSGELRIKAIIVAKDGKKEAWHYRLHAQPVAAPEQSRILIGQGLRAVYWGFEVEAIDGAAFMIDLLDLHPLAMSHVGRIQGEGGGSR